MDATDDRNIFLFNTAKTLLLNKLIKEKYITQDQYDEIDVGWQFILYKPKWYERLSNLINVRKEDEDNIQVRLVKIENKETVLNLLLKKEDENE